MSTAGTKAKNKVLVPVTFPSHPKIGSWGKKQIQGTKGHNRPAIFKPGTPYSPEGFAAQYTQANLIPQDAPPDDVHRWWKKFNYVVGASGGKETKYILIKRDCCRVHARPVNENELKRVHGVHKL